MTKTNHTPEPWKVKDVRIAGLLAWDIDSDSGLITFESGISEENARRIVACVNACKGFTTEELEDLEKYGESLRVQEKWGDD